MGTDNELCDDSTRVLVISQLFPPESMAGSHRWQKLIESLPSRFDCHVVCPHPSVPVGTFERTYAPWKTERIEGIPVTRLWTYQSIEDRSNIERILNHVIFSIFACLYVLFRFRRYDCVIVQIGPHTTLFPGIVAKLLGCRLVVDIYDMWLDNTAELGFLDRDSIPYRVIAWMEKYTLEQCDHIIVLTPTMAIQYQTKYDLDGEQFTPIPFGVDENLFDPDIKTEHEERIIYTGKLGEGQAFGPFLRAFRGLETNHDLLIVGFGERRAELERFCETLGIAERVAFSNPVPRHEIPALLAASTMSWVPLKTEHQLDYARPTKLLETMAVGTPYVASRVEEVGIVTDQSRGGLAVENDPDEIKAAMATIISDSERRERMGERAIEFIDAHHRWDTLGAKVGTVLSNATKR